MSLAKTDIGWQIGNAKIARGAHPRYDIIDHILHTVQYIMCSNSLGTARMSPCRNCVGPT